jgi:hypothetical protein
VGCRGTRVEPVAIVATVVEMDSGGRRNTVCLQRPRPESCPVRGELVRVLGIFGTRSVFVFELAPE